MKIAVIGLGSIGRRHVRIIKNVIPDIYIISVRTGRGGSVPEDEIVNERVKNIEHAIDRDVDGVIISSPASYHIRDAIKCIESGIPVLIEKPLSAKYSEANKLLESKHSNSKAFDRSLVGYVLRYHPAYDRLLKIVRDKEFGILRGARIDSRSYLPEWRPEKDYRKSVSAIKRLGGGVLRELSHEIDFTMSILGRFKSVYATRNEISTIDINTEERVDMIANINSDISISMNFDFASSIPVRRFCAWFTEGKVCWDLLNQTIKITKINGEKYNESHKVEKDIIFIKQFNNFIKCINGEENAKCTINEGIYVMKVIDAIEYSFKTQCKVDII